VKLSICPAAAGAAEAAALIVAQQLAAKPESVLGLPTGRTSLGIYEEIVRKTVPLIPFDRKQADAVLT